MDSGTRVQILDEAVCISHSANNLGKSLNPIILPPAVDKLLGRLGSLTLVGWPVLEKENSEFKPLKFR